MLSLYSSHRPASRGFEKKHSKTLGILLLPLPDRVDQTGKMLPGVTLSKTKWPGFPAICKFCLKL